MKVFLKVLTLVSLFCFFFGTIFMSDSVNSEEKVLELLALRLAFKHTVYEVKCVCVCSNPCKYPKRALAI